MWELVEDEAASAGLKRYEVSNFAHPGFECRHNLDIWYGATYLGCGPAAVSFDGKHRRTNPADLTAWLGHSEPEVDELPPADRAAEILAFGLRTVKGWDLKLFQNRTGIDALKLRGDAIEELTKLNLAVLEESNLRPTKRGLLFADLMAEKLI
jgi:oxygen-independent coproporphyrinogen-3 oxidase